MLSIPTNPYMLLVILGVVTCAISLVLAVQRTLRNPSQNASFNEALRMYTAGSELDIDTALNRSGKPKESLSHRWYTYWHNMATSSGAIPKSPEAPGHTAVSAGILGAAFGFLVTPGGIVGAILVGFLGVFGYRTYLGTQARKRISTMEKQLPNLLSGMRANLQAGATPQQALMSVADDMPSPLGDELKILKRDLDVNIGMHAALADLASRVPSREMQFLVASIEIAMRSGVDLDPQMETIQGIVAQRTRIRQKLKAAIAQVKPTKLLAMAAVPGMFVFSMQDPDNRGYWFGEGLFMLVVDAILYGLGVFVISMMVKRVENT